MIRKTVLILLAFVFYFGSFAQKNHGFPTHEVSRIVNNLASDEMRGRRAGTPGIDLAAQFISDEFGKAGLEPHKGNSYFQEFTMVRPVMKSLKAEVDDKEIDIKELLIISTRKDLKVNEKSGYRVEMIKAGENISQKARQFLSSGNNSIVHVDRSFAEIFPRLSFLRNQLFTMDHNVIFILGHEEMKEFTFKLEQDLKETAYKNVIGILPGKSRKNEFVIFSAHYDHMGVTSKPVNGDSIFNGANDNAAGVTAVILLADYFKKLASNERTIIFVAFTAEEMGGFGSRYFSENMDPEQVVAMFNIEMVGTESKWGKNSAFITGYEKSDMGKIMQRNLKGSGFSFHPDPYPAQNLFYRSDNATLARLGVPAHTISTAKMENEPNYHKVTDHVETLNLENMSEIIKAIAISSSSIIAGLDTPQRVRTENLN